MALVQLLRVEQWSKNLFLLAGLVFGQKLTDMPSVWAALQGFLCFSLISSGVYVINDIRDRVEDRLHPKKRFRPIASGRISVATAVVVALLVLAGGMGGAYALDRGFFGVGLIYLTLQAAYNFGLKGVVLIDVIIIGIGFVLRAIAGAVLVHVEISHWLVLCTFTLCLFMGFSKRRCELNALALNGNAQQHRRTLALYTPELLNHMTTLTAGIAVVSFMLYATDERTKLVYQTDDLIYTLPLVVYAIFRFALLVEHGRVSGPTDVLLRDRPFQAALLAWAVIVIALIYAGPAMRDWLTEWIRPGAGAGPSASAPANSG